MTLRRRLFGWLALVHLAFAAIAVAVVRHDRSWLIAVEVLLAVSLAATWRLMRLLRRPREIARTGAELLRERDFGSRFREVGEGEVDGLVRLFNTMSERLREERLKLEEQHLFLAKLVAASPAGILIFDYQGCLAVANPAAERLLGTPPSLTEVAALSVGESRLLTVGGNRRLKGSRAEFFDQGHRRSFVVVEELTGELRATERAAYERLIRLMSHEVNNSVGAVGSLLDSCRTYAGQLAAADRGDFESALGVAVSRLENLRDFMAGFAELVRLPPPEPAGFDVKRLVDDVMRVMGPELARRRIRWRWRPAEPPPSTVTADKNQLEQVLLNVVKNAAEAIGENGEVDLALGREEGGGRRPFLAVGDSGPGLAADVRDRLFTPFFSTKSNGRGLGLTLVSEILAQHGFAFSLENRPAGGAVFRVWLS